MDRKELLRVFEKKSRSWESIPREIAKVCNVRASPRIQTAIHGFRF